MDDQKNIKPDFSKAGEDSILYKKEEPKTEREKLKELHGKDKIWYLVHYYGLQTIVALAIIGTISFLIIHLCVSNQVLPELPNPYMVIAFSTVLVPLLDVIRVVLHRLRNHRNPFLPDKNHFHHKLLRTGMRVRMVMVTILCVSVFFIVLNVLLAMKVNASYLLLLNLVLWSILHLTINRFITRHHKEQELKEIGGIFTK